ncbi:hypothetical protein MAR_022622 [Mya arenaria]|uniref:Uncharacterized protein n=1 Tax=Mya arenaria TaxID=6604 RepID=A0ABY7DKN0_MYAAR|nr:hypothetical protein MAR_022622 [Mya arenaria]
MTDRTNKKSRVIDRPNLLSDLKKGPNERPTDRTHCYEGKACYDGIWNTIQLINTIYRTRQPRDVYVIALKRASDICAKLDDVNCSRRMSDDLCGNVHTPNTYTHADSVRRTDNYWNNRETCTQEDCIVEKLTDEYHPCIQRYGIPAVPTTCSEVDTMYSCMLTALRDTCGNQVNVVFDAVMMSLPDSPVCYGIKTYNAGVPLQLTWSLTIVLTLLATSFTI